MIPASYAHCRRRAAALLDRLLGRAPRPPCVLVVDDVPEVAELLRLMLAGAGYEIHEVHSGPETLRAARALRPDVILLNFLMPEMDGLEALARLKSDPILRGSKVIMQSAHAGGRAEARARELGALDWLHKPFGLKRLLPAIEKALGA